MKSYIAFALGLGIFIPLFAPRFDSGVLFMLLQHQRNKQAFMRAAKRKAADASKSTRKLVQYQDQEIPREFTRPRYCSLTGQDLCLGCPRYEPTKTNKCCQ